MGIRLDQISPADEPILRSLSFAEHHQSTAIRSYGLFLITWLFIINGLRLGLIYLLPNVYSEQIRSSMHLCLAQSFSLHALTLLHFHVTVFQRLFWHYCLIFDDYWPRLTIRRLSSILFFIFLCLCLITYPSISDEWASVRFDKVLGVCLVDYTYNYSYTFFVVALTCLIPLILLFISHRVQMQTIEQEEILKEVSTDQQSELLDQKNRFQRASIALLLWSFLSILLIIVLHSPIDHVLFRTVVYKIEIVAILVDPLIHLFVFRSLSLLIRLKSFNGIYSI